MSKKIECEQDSDDFIQVLNSDDNLVLTISEWQQKNSVYLSKEKAIELVGYLNELIKELE